jgi:PIN domain nuclease of toxin-antitoxin system
MTVLLDTHVLLWWFLEPKRLSRRALAVLTGNEQHLLVSAACTWEIAIKVSLGKLDAADLIPEFPAYLAERGFFEQPISIHDTIRAGLLPLHHRDPFDRLLIAQAQAMNFPILSADKQFDRYGIKRLW